MQIFITSILIKRKILIFIIYIVETQNISKSTTDQQFGKYTDTVSPCYNGCRYNRPGRGTSPTTHPLKKGWLMEILCSAVILR